MTSNHRAHQRWALSATIRLVPRDIWRNLKRLLWSISPGYWKFVYDLELLDIQREAYEAEQQEARERLQEEDFVKSFPEVEF
jgi:hypothetical protein